MITCAVQPPRGEAGTVRVGSWDGFACPNQLLHLLTGYSVSPRQFHCSVTTSLIREVTEY